MKETLIGLETAKLTKDKGFDEMSEKYYEESSTGNLEKISGNDYWNRYKRAFAAPPQGLLQKWLREIHKLDVAIYSTASGYDYTIDKAYYTGNISGGTQVKDGNYTGSNLSGRWETYEEALEAGLQEALKLI